MSGLTCVGSGYTLIKTDSCDSIRTVCRMTHSQMGPLELIMINTNQKLMIHNPPFILMSHPRGWHLFQNSYIFKDAQLLG